MRASPFETARSLSLSLEPPYREIRSPLQCCDALNITLLLPEWQQKLTAPRRERVAAVPRGEPAERAHARGRDARSGWQHLYSLIRIGSTAITARSKHNVDELRSYATAVLNCIPSKSYKTFLHRILLGIPYRFAFRSLWSWLAEVGHLSIIPRFKLSIGRETREQRL
jgi:hypothetical protein